MTEAEEQTIPKELIDTEGVDSVIDAQDETRKKDFPMQSPPLDWDYRLLLKNIAKLMKEEDVKVAKSMFKGEFKRELTEKLHNAMDLFDVLERRGFLNENNLLYLQSLLLHISRHDLFEEVAKFASETLQNVVYFMSPPDVPAPGHKYAYFHIKGHDFGDLYTRSSLEDLRSKAAKIMGVLPQYITIPGVELSESIMVTMMISMEHIERLVSALKNKNCRNDLASLGVDEVRIDDKVWKVEEAYEVILSEQQDQQQKIIRKLREELQKYKDILQKRDMEMIDKKQTLEAYEVIQSEQKDQQQTIIRKLREELQKNKDILQKRDMEMIDKKHTVKVFTPQDKQQRRTQSAKT